MSTEDLESYEADAQLALYREYQNVAELFTYTVETDRRFYLANAVDIRPHSSGDTVYFEVQMSDVWVWDIFRASRFVKNVKVFSFKDLNVEERQGREELVVPQITNFSDPQ